MLATKLVILDKNFLQSEDPTTPRLHTLARCGCEFVLIDTLIYEICSDTRRATLWPSLQKKLFRFADRLHLWMHTSELIRQEVANNAPVRGPEDKDATDRLRAWFRSGQVYVPTNLQEFVEDARQQREIDTMEAVAPMARALGNAIAESSKNTGVQKLSKEDLASRVSDNLNDKRLIRWAIQACYGNPDSPTHYIQDAVDRVDETWFAFHNARATLALIGVFLKKYGLGNEPGKKFPNTKLDLDYLSLLTYADAIASDETAGDMAEVLKWLYGTTKKQIPSAQLLGLVPDEHKVRRTAYGIWDNKGQTHGHDVDDWLTAEDGVMSEVWDRLGLRA